MVKIISAAFIVAQASCLALGTEMDAQAKVLTTFKTARSGVAELTCDDPKG